MQKKQHFVIIGLILFLSLNLIDLGTSIDSEKITLTIRKNVGSNFGEKISGDFTIRGSGDQDITSLHLYFNGTEVANSSSASLEFRFKTQEYGVGIMNITLIGLDNSMNAFQRSITREFMSSTMDAIIIVVVGIIIAVSLSFSLYRKRHQKKVESQSVDEMKSKIRIDIDKDFK